MAARPVLWIVIPCYNEEQVLPLTAPMFLSKLRDLTARGIISEQGYGEYFNHRLGHFIGLSEHEYGDVSSACDWPVEPGMIFSIEPGIYLGGDVGVRIEDLVLVTGDGFRRLNLYPHELEILP